MITRGTLLVIHGLLHSIPTSFLAPAQPTNAAQLARDTCSSTTCPPIPAASGPIPRVLCSDRRARSQPAGRLGPAQATATGMVNTGPLCFCAKCDPLSPCVCVCVSLLPRMPPPPPMAYGKWPGDETRPIMTCGRERLSLRRPCAAQRGTGTFGASPPLGG